ncbi:zn 2cys6 transcription factor [Diplodia corticola]|uniref:Zn 2cys6 transcription factor n=1 Tax=Diplodia corticola TaxID=236234 RepID=A0A1J9QUR1_9PEZI|nr:zn 2cys6 transcription factor [Diplodia corticola]OJD32176.1 zn 2cys6 transcription factor [Diplodia corticola]
MATSADAAQPAALSAADLAPMPTPHAMDQQQHSNHHHHPDDHHHPPSAPSAASAPDLTPTASPSADGHPHPPDHPPRKKQKRNKPTLSCDCCVERKTKCDRGRPHCLACIKRQSECRYSEVANLIASAERNGGRATSKARKKAMEQAQLGVVTPSASSSEDYGFWIYSHHPANDLLGLTELHEHQGCPRPQQYRSQSTSSTSSSVHQLLSNVPYTKHTPSLVFGLGSEHPFSNYWTMRGGLQEVIGVLPRREQADILVAKYFEAVDPVYPMIHRPKFDADYERFWSLSHEEKCQADSALLGLHFVVYAMGTQFIQMPDPQERAQIAEFYVSAAHQALRISGYLSRISLRTIQAMVLINYFLMNNNHASDAWSFGGVLMRQAYAMGLNRDPELIVPRASALEKQQRRKVWQAVLFQDTFLTVLLKLPPTATISDVHVDSLTDEPEGEHDNGSNARNTPDLLPNPMRISNIAPPPTSLLPHELADRNYIRTMWKLANLVQRNICIPRSLSRPLTNSPREKSNLLTSFRSLHANIPASMAQDITKEFVAANQRLAKQMLFFRSNYHHCVMLLLADENESCGVKCDVRGALESARLAIHAFVDLWEYLRVDAGVWWVFQHRAFEEALMMARLLVIQQQEDSPYQKQTKAPIEEPLLVAAKHDIRKVIEILDHVGSGAPEMQKTRTEVLRTAFEDIAW